MELFSRENMIRLVCQWLTPVTFLMEKLPAILRSKYRQICIQNFDDQLCVGESCL